MKNDLIKKYISTSILTIGLVLSHILYFVGYIELGVLLGFDILGFFIGININEIVKLHKCIMQEKNT